MISAIVSCTSSNQTDKIKLMTLDPGHFHASLIQKTSYENIDLTVDVYAPEGPEVNSFLKSIDAYNNREENPTNWKINKANRGATATKTEKKMTARMRPKSSRTSTKKNSKTLPGGPKIARKWFPGRS